VVFRNWLRVEGIRGSSKMSWKDEDARRKAKRIVKDIPRLVSDIC